MSTCLSTWMASFLFNRAFAVSADGTGAPLSMGNLLLVAVSRFLDMGEALIDEWLFIILKYKHCCSSGSSTYKVDEKEELLPRDGEMEPKNGCPLEPKTTQQPGSQARTRAQALASPAASPH